MTLNGANLASVKNDKPPLLKGGSYKFLIDMAYRWHDNVAIVCIFNKKLYLHFIKKKKFHLHPSSFVDIAKNGTLIAASHFSPSLLNLVAKLLKNMKKGTTSASSLSSWSTNRKGTLGYRDFVSV